VQLQQPLPAAAAAVAEQQHQGVLQTGQLQLPQLPMHQLVLRLL
jgi:hypothetical protein